MYMASKALVDRRVFAVPSLVFIAACTFGGDSLVPRTPLPEAELTILSGANQTVRRGDSLSQRVVARLDTAGVPAADETLEFIVQALASPGPNHTWFGDTGADGIASANGVVVNTGPMPSTITVRYVVCVVPGFKDCSRYETRATAVTGLTVTN
jgi:hypothetical protein